MKKSILLLAVMSASVTFSQTKKIFHKSHSGTAGTLFMDSKNNFGPGQAPVRYRTPESPIKLNKIVTDKQEYPLVEIDTITKVMKFIDLNDSIIGCNRNYEEYLRHGDMVYDNKSNEFYAYYSALNVKKKHLKLFVNVSDSIAVWEKKRGYIVRRQAFIRDGNNFRIIMHYPHLNYAIATNLIKTPAPENEVSPTPKKTPESETGKEKNKKKKTPHTKPTRPQPVSSLGKNDEENEAFIVAIPSGNDTTTLRWIGLFFFVFSLFIFVGVKRIVAEEISKINR